MGELTHLKQGPGVTPHCVLQTVVRIWWQSPGKGRLPVIGGIDVRLAHQLPGKPAEGHTPHPNFDKNNHSLGPGASTQEGQSGA